VPTPDPHPLAPSAGAVYLNSPAVATDRGCRSQIPRFLVIVDKLELHGALALQYPGTSLTLVYEAPGVA
jgi:hypothetical protein